MKKTMCTLLQIALFIAVFMVYALIVSQIKVNVETAVSFYLYEVITEGLALIILFFAELMLVRLTNYPITLAAFIVICILLVLSCFAVAINPDGSVSDISVIQMAIFFVLSVIFLFALNKLRDKRRNED